MTNASVRINLFHGFINRKVYWRIAVRNRIISNILTISVDLHGQLSARNRKTRRISLYYIICIVTQCNLEKFTVRVI